MSGSDVLGQLDSSEGGLSKKQVGERLVQYGPNEISKRKVRAGLFIFLSQFKNPLVIILIGASIVAAFLGELTDAMIIIVIVVINGLLGFFQEYRSEKAVERLGKYITFTAKVIREGEKRHVDTKELVPGDVVLLGTGDVVPGDMRLLNVDELSIDESSLTGESYPVRKTSSEISAESPPIHEMKNIGFMGTYVKGGEGSGVIIATGKDTYLGKTAQLLKKIKRESEFQKTMTKFGYTLIEIVLASVVLIFLINVLLVRDIISTILFSVALAIGMVPEALPIVITIALSSGALLLAKKNVIVKRLVSVEDLGNVDTVCTDKTGTITENKLTLEKYVDVNGKPEDKLILYSLLCNSIRKKKDIGNPIDTAIWNYTQQNFDTKALEKYSVIKEMPFDSTRKKMTVVIRANGKLLLISKGAPESILDISTHVWQNSEVSLLKDKESAKKLYEEYGNKGYRVIAVAYKEVEEKESYTKDDEFGLTLLGYIAFIDPPKRTAKDAIKLSRKMGIEVKILTGDGPYVSKEIARQVGLKVEDDEVMLGQEVDKLTDEELQEKVNKIVVFSRATPEHKYRVVKALRKNGRVTACLGDGVNDAPALKEADVGIAVDKGSDIAKDAADIILLKKGLKVIVDGIREGRRTFSNIVKYVIYTISGNFGDLYTIGAASAVLHFLPLLPSQLILANFVTDTPVVAVSTDNVEKEALVRPRRWDITHIFKFGGILGLVSAVFDVILILLLFFVFNLGAVLFRTALFVEIVLSEVLVLFMIRTDKFFLKSTPPSKKLVLASAIALFITFALIYLPITSIFEFTSLPLLLLGVIILVTVGYIIVTEIVKLAYFKKLIKPHITPMLTAQLTKVKTKISESQREFLETIEEG
ncbi:MAG: magnesium-translocating P-type ATPase [Candidatus Bathyarchaeota archaeon]|nr:magnesium-translocating P-type ATPase [Candidatus Bathyarchaeota archaeon]